MGPDTQGITREHAAELAGVSIKTIDRALKMNELHRVKVGRRTMVNEAELLLWRRMRVAQNNYYAVITIDGWSWLDLSDNLAALVGHRRSTLLGRPIDRVVDRAESAERRRALAEIGFVTGNTRLRHRNGRWIPVAYRAAVVRDTVVLHVAPTE